MSEQLKVLLLGGTGRTGGRVFSQLLERGVAVRAIVRSSARLPKGEAGNERLEEIEADLLSLGDDELKKHIAGCGAIISCLGHTTSTFKGIFGPPRDLVKQDVARACSAAQALKPEKAVKFVLMSSVSVNGPRAADARRGAFEKAFLRILRGLVPPAADNQNAADYLQNRIGPADPVIQWVVVRPDSLAEGDVSEYLVHEGLATGLIKPKTTAMANVAHFMCELVTKPQVWDAWKGRMPVVVDVTGTL